MDFDVSEDQAQLRDAVHRWAEKSYGFERRREIIRAGESSRAIWAELAGLGLTGLAVDEAHGGMGFGPVEAMIVQEELGSVLMNEPYAAVCLVAAALLGASTAPDAAPWLQGIADGSQQVVLAHLERAARYRLQHVTTRATAQGEAWTVTGLKQLVPGGSAAGAYLVPARVSGTDDDPAGIAIFLVVNHQAEVHTRDYALQDGSRAGDVRFEAASATLLLPAGAAWPALEHAADIGLAALCAEAVGAMDKLVLLTADYLNTRKQFGVAIASFQALRHRLADMKMQLELARSMSYLATLKLQAPAEQRRRALSQAKVQLGQSMRFVGQQAVQLHGGIGVTDEYIGSHYFKRLTCLEMTWGDTLHHLGEVSERLQDTAGVFA